MPPQELSSTPGYGGLAKFLHWSIAMLIAAQFALGWSMPHIGRNTRPGTLINLHFSFGMLILLLAIVRLAWRLQHQVPLVTTNVPLWQQRTASAVHRLLYVLLFAIPVPGWVSASGRNFPV